MLRTRARADLKQGLTKVLDILKSDPRVKHLGETHIEHVRLRAPSFADAGIDSKPDYGSKVPISPTVHIHALAVHPPIRFTVQIPRRVQIRGDANEESIPTDEYWVAWDGILLVVLWRPEGDNPYGSGGGLAVIKLLEDVAEKAGSSLHVEPCGPNCNYPFVHRDILLARVAGDDRTDDRRPAFEESGRWLSTLAVHDEPKSPYSAAALIFSQVRMVSYHYANLRSDGRAISETEKTARLDLRNLLAIYHDAAALGHIANPKSWKARWKQRGRKRQIERLIARLWLSLSAMESRRHDWNNSKLRYDKAASIQGLDQIYRHEYQDEINNVSALEVRSIEASVNYASSHVNNQSVVAATAIGAVAGAIIGALTAGLIQLAANPTPPNPAVAPAPGSSDVQTGNDGPSAPPSGLQPAPPR